MKTFLGITSALLSGLAAPTARATNFAVLLTGIEGESTDPATPGAVVVEGFGITGPLFTGQPSEITFHKSVDKATPLLFKHCATGKHIPKVTLSLKRDGAGARDYLKIELKEVLISSMSQGGDDGASNNAEAVHLRCSSIFYRYYPESPDTSSAPVFMALATSGPDTDRDGMSDEYEKHFGLNPAVRDATGDLDGDGLSNGEEARLGRNPASGASFFEVAVVEVPGLPGAVDLAWDAVPGQSYQIEWSADPASRFTVLETFTPTEPAAVRRLTRTGLTGFFRVRPAP